MYDRILDRIEPDHLTVLIPKSYQHNMRMRILDMCDNIL